MEGVERQVEKQADLAVEQQERISANSSHFCF